MLNMIQKKVVNAVGWTAYPLGPTLGFLAARHVRWYLQLLRLKHRGKEERLVDGSCVL